MPIAHPRLGDLANEFTSTFAMLEYAMKQDGHYEVRGNGEIVSSWAKLVAAYPAINDAYLDALKSNAVTGYMVAKPPKFRAEVDNGLGEKRLGWRDPSPVETIKQLWEAVKRTRNNLFHGDKTAWDDTRDPDLIRSGLAIMDELLNMAPSVRAKFETGVIMFAGQE